MICSICGETMIGDGCTIIVHCPNSEYETYAYSAPDDYPVECAPCADPLAKCQT